MHLLHVPLLRLFLDPGACRHQNFQSQAFLSSSEEVPNLALKINKLGRQDGICWRSSSWKKGLSLLITALLHWFLHSDADGDYRCGKAEDRRKEQESAASMVKLDSVSSPSQRTNAEKTLRRGRSEGLSSTLFCFTVEWWVYLSSSKTMEEVSKSSFLCQSSVGSKNPYVKMDKAHKASREAILFLENKLVHSLWGYCKIWKEFFFLQKISLKSSGNLAFPLPPVFL